MTDELDPKKRSLSETIGGHTKIFVSLAALVTAVAAVVITLEQTKEMREEAELERNNARISVLPSVWLSTHVGDAEGESYYKIVLTNKGLGPAVIERFDVLYQGQPVYNWDELARKHGNTCRERQVFRGTLSAEYTLTGWSRIVAGSRRHSLPALG